MITNNKYKYEKYKMKYLNGSSFFCNEEDKIIKDLKENNKLLKDKIKNLEESIESFKYKDVFSNYTNYNNKNFNILNKLLNNKDDKLNKIKEILDNNNDVDDYNKIKFMLNNNDENI